MITVIATYQSPKPITRDEGRRIFLSTVPKYQGASALAVKTMSCRKTGARSAGPDLWNSRAEADAM